MALFLQGCLSSSGPSGGLSDSSADASSLAISQVFPIVSIQTAGAAPITSKDVYINAQMTIDSACCNTQYNFSGDLKIKGRGNSTWGMPKKPYKLKLNSKSSILGMPADKEWILLANYSDKTLMRTSVAFEWSRRLGLGYTPRSQYVELVLNGVYQGNYLLVEQIKIAPDRVNVTPLAATDIAGDAVTGGYLVELDQRRDETVVITTSRNIPYALKEPSDARPEQIAYIRDYLQTSEDVLNSGLYADPVDGYEKYIDVDSFVNWYLLSELFKNQDAAAFSSIYFYKDRNKKLVIGPAWDFDLAAGNVNYSDAQYPEGWWIRTGSPWYSRLFQDPVFENRVKARWRALKAEQIDTLADYIDRTAFGLQLTQERNFSLWQILNIYVWPNAVVTGSYSGEVAYFKQWLNSRINWLNQQFQ